MGKVLVVMGSDSDLPVVKKGIKVLKDFDVECEVRVISAHRTPDTALEVSKNAKDNGFDVIITAAGKLLILVDLWQLIQLFLLSVFQLRLL